MDVEHVNLRSVFWPCSHCTIFADTLGSKMLLLGFCSSEKSFFCKWQTRAYMKRMTEYSECSESEGKRCRAHFLLQVFGEGYDVNHWELNDEVKLFSSVSQSCPTATSRTAARQVSLSNTNSWSSLKLMPIELVMPSNHRPLSVPFSSRLRAFSNESALRIRWPKYWSFSFNISPSSAFSGLISFRLDWLDLLAVQGTLRSLLQHISKASILGCSVFFIVQLSHPYMTTGKAIALTRGTFSYLEPICCFMSSSKCYFLTFIQISQEAGQVVWYSHLFQNFPVYCDPHSQRFWHSQ